MTQSASTPMNYPTLLGVYLAVNAISDAYVLVDGPDCTLYKAHFIHGRHDLNSTLLSVDGHHRVAFTNVCSRGVVKEHDDILRRHIGMVGAVKKAKLVLVTALPMCSITGVDYGRVIRSMGKSLKKPAIDIPPDSLVGDWLDGYAQTLAALAGKLELVKKRKPKGTVAVVGYFMDRNESDHHANTAEIRRMLGGLSLETVSIWLDGGGVASLGKAQEAELIISLPHGRAAARRLSERTGAKLVETCLPFGLPKTERFLRDVGKASGKTSAAQSFIETELRRVIPRLKWIVPHVFLHKKTAFMGDPYLLEGFMDIAEDMGMSVEWAILRGRRAHGGGRPGLTVLHEPPVFSAEVRRITNTPLDLFVSNYCESEWPALENKKMEFGFPSYRHHVLFERPFLGFNGFLAFVDRMAGHISERGRPRRLNGG